MASAEMRERLEAPLPDRAVPIYVAGFLALYDSGDPGELALDPDTVRAALPPENPLPINVDHRARCEVGRVLAVVNDPRGPFFVGLIACVQLERVLETAASAAIFERRGPALSREERLLYLITNYLPSVSLSTKRRGDEVPPDRTLFAHVALCAIGRRLGTIVTYDTSLDAAIAPFRHLDPATREGVRREAAEAELALAGRTWAPGVEALTHTLLSTAVNNMMLRDRWSLVAERRRQAGIAGHTYLQASEKFKIWGAESAPAPERGYKTGAPGAMDTSPAASVPAPQVAVRARQVASSSSSSSSFPAPADMNPVSASGAPAPPPPGDGSYLWIPASHYNQLVTGQSAPHHPPLTACGLPAAGTVAYGHPGAGPSPHYPPPPAHPYPGMLFAGPSPLEAQIAALVGAIAADRQAGGLPAAAGDHGIRGSAKRRRHEVEQPEYDCGRDEPDRDLPYYPGEARPEPRPVDSRRAARQASGPHETITALVGAVTSLQQELAHMRARTHAPYGPYPPVGPYHHPHADTETPAQPPRYPAEAVYLPPPHIAPPGPPLSGAVPPPSYPPVAVTPGPAPPLHQPSPAHAHPPPPPPGPTPPPAASLPQPEAPGAEAGALVNASSAAHVNVDTARAADLFVSQMMGSR
uniref:Capsid scaffolding protein n=1 Tax=Human herpesvirus 2 TaxID=10310 RepID=A0A481TSW7_HHV2|nr:UL26 [Human alphaherpesvirus 2]